MGASFSSQNRVFRFGNVEYRRSEAHADPLRRPHASVRVHQPRLAVREGPGQVRRGASSRPHPAPTQRPPLLHQATPPASSPDGFVTLNSRNSCDMHILRIRARRSFFFCALALRNPKNKSPFRSAHVDTEQQKVFSV